MDRRFEGVDRRFDAIDGRFDAIDRRFERVDDRLSRQFLWLVGIQVTTLASVWLPSRRSRRAEALQFSEGRSIDSITMMRTGAVVGSSFSPSCS